MHGVSASQKAVIPGRFFMGVALILMGEYHLFYHLSPNYNCNTTYFAPVFQLLKGGKTTKHSFMRRYPVQQKTHTIFLRLATS
jgi:hypothetical protein